MARSSRRGPIWALVATLLVLAVGATFANAAAPPPPARLSSLGARPPTALSQGVAGGRSAQAHSPLQIVEPLRLSTSMAAVGEPIAATARLKNVGARPLKLRYLIAAGRGPNIPGWECGTLIWSQCGADFGEVEDLTLQPGEEYAYRGLRAASRRGAYWAEMVYQDAETGQWGGVTGGARVTYGVSGGELAVVQPLTLSPAPRFGGTVTAMARVRNVGDAPLAMRYLTAAGRGPDCADWGCDGKEWDRIADFSMAEDVVLQPGEEYAYRGLAVRPSRGSYFAEIAYVEAATGDWVVGSQGATRADYTIGCDARCELIDLAYREVVGRAPDVEAMRAAYDTGWDEPTVRGYLCALAEGRANGCGHRSALVDVTLDASSITAGEQRTATLRLRNVGSAPWLRDGANPVVLGPSAPNGRSSRFYTAGTWLSPSRAARLAEERVAPGEVGTFRVVLTAPSQGGEYRESFNTTADGLAWSSGPGATLTLTVAPREGSALGAFSAFLPLSLFGQR